MSEMNELLKVVSKLPLLYQKELEAPLAALLEAVKRKAHLMQLIQDALGQVRLDMKYLIFDLEATRRERDEFRSKVE